MHTSPAPPRRRMTIVRAVKKTLGRTSSISDSDTAEGLTRQNTSTLPTSLRSTPLLPRSVSVRSTRSSGEWLTRNNSTESLGAEPPVRRESHQQQQQQQQQSRGAQLEALPTVGFYERFPRAVGPLANVLIATPEEHRIFCLTARAIKIVATREERSVAKDRLCIEDIAKGGFFVYQPNSDTPRYFLLHDKKVDVYGTSSYIRR